MYAPRGEEYRKIHQGNYRHYEDFIELLAKLGAKMMAEVFRNEWEDGDRKRQTL